MASRGNTKLPGFYFPWPVRGVQFARQIDQSRENTFKLAPLTRAAYVDPQPVTANDPGNHDLSGWAIGMRDFRNKFRIWYDQDNKRFSIQHNIGTEAVETWDDMISIREIDGRVTVWQYGGLEAQGGFYNEVPKNLATSGRFAPAAFEWQFTHNLGTKPILWDTYNLEDKSITPQTVDVSDPNTAYFYFATAQAGYAVVTGQQSRFEGIRVDDGTNVFDHATRLGFDGRYFYMASDGHGMPVVALQPLDLSQSNPSTIPVNLKVTDTAASETFDLSTIGQPKLVFNQPDFYFTSDANGNPTINIRGGAGGSGGGQFGIGVKSTDFTSTNELQFNHGLGVGNVVWAVYDDNGYAIIPEKVSTHNFNVAYFYFNPAIAGRAVIAGGPVLNSITVAETDGSPSESATKITFNSNDFYIKNDSGGNPIVNFRGTAGGGGGSFNLNVQEVDGSPNVNNVTTIKVSNGTLTDNGGGTVTITTGGSGGDIKSDGSVAFAANESMGGFKLTNVADPTSAQDAATKNYVDTNMTPGFYGVIWSDGTVTKRTDRLSFNGVQFYLDGSRPTVNLHDDQTFNTITLTRQASLPPTTPNVTHGILFAKDNNGHGTINWIDDEGANDTYELGRDSIFVAQNVTGSPLAKGQAVYISGTAGSVPTVALAQANSATTMPAVGITAQAIVNNGFGRIISFGQLSSVNTSGYSAGSTLFVSPTSAGALTNTEPTFPNFDQQVGTALDSTVFGSIWVNANHADNQDTGTNKSSFAIGTSAASSVVLTPASTAQRTITFQDRSGTLALTDQLNDFYHLAVRTSSSVNPTFATQTLIFGATDFYLKADSQGKPTVWSRQNAGGSSSITFTATDDVHTISQVGSTPKLNLNASHFYLSQSATGAPVVNLRYEKDTYPVYIDFPTAQQVAVDPFAQYAYTIEKVDFDCLSGTATGGFYIVRAANRSFARDGTGVTGLDPLNFSNTAQTVYATGANTVNPGDVVQFSLYQNSAARKVRLVLTCKKPN